MVINMMENGKIIKKEVMVFFIIIMVINMMVNGKMIKKMGKVFFIIKMEKVVMFEMES